MRLAVRRCRLADRRAVARLAGRRCWHGPRARSVAGRQNARANVERNGATVAARARDARRGRGRRRMRRFRASRTTDGGTGTERRRDGSKNHNAWSWRGWNASATNGTARRRKSARRFPE